MHLLCSSPYRLHNSSKRLTLKACTASYTQHLAEVKPEKQASAALLHLSETEASKAEQEPSVETVPAMHKMDSLVAHAQELLEEMGEKRKVEAERLEREAPPFPSL